MKYKLNPVVADRPSGTRECPKCILEVFNNDPKKAELWRKQALENSELFLVSQFKKPLDSFNTRDAGFVNKLCSKYMSKQRWELLTGLNGFKNRLILAAKESAPGKFEPLTYVEAIRIFNRYKLGDMEPRNLARYLNDPVIVKLLPPKLLEEKFKSTVGLRFQKLTKTENLMALPEYATMKDINKALGEFPNAVIGPDGNIELPPEIWRRIRHESQRKLKDWPIAMQKEYGKPFMLLPGVKQGALKPEPTPKIPKVKPNAKPPRIESVKPKVIKPAITHAPKKRDEDSEFLEGWDDLEEPKPKAPDPVSAPTHVLNSHEVIEFINKKANTALLPGDIPRGLMTPVTKWSNQDWLMVHKFKDWIDPQWYASHEEEISKALRMFNRTIGASTNDIGVYSEIYDTFAQISSIIATAGV